MTVSAVQTWRARHGTDRTAEAIAKAPSFPQPDVYLGEGSPQAGYLEGRLEEITAWRESMPGPGAGGGRPRKDAVKGE